MARGRRMPGGLPGGMPGGKNNMMKQIQKMQEEMMKTQAALEEKEAEATAGGAAVTVKVNGKKQLSAVKIDPDVIDEDDIEMLEDLIIAAANEALAKIDEITSTEMGKFTGGMNIPGLF
ncbi:MAG: YbaB/EbfC family nucleoid-associated protein [Eubacterium sp.]|nr:YbaB/EbfC family nucleoid-associated protein [Eubacterium sp.]